MASSFPIKTLTELRDAFWEEHPQFADQRRARKKQNEYVADIRMSWVDYVDQMSRGDQISENLADRATL